MIKLKYFLEDKIEITWKLLFLGWQGIEKIDRLLEAEEIINFAIDCVQENSSDSEILILAGLSYHEKWEISNILNQLATQESFTSYDTEKRKWVYILLKKRMINLSDNPLYGLLELSDFWASLNYPQNCPFVFQGVNNSINPIDYYTKDYFNKIKESHQDWLNKEYTEIVS